MSAPGSVSREYLRRRDHRRLPRVGAALAVAIIGVVAGVSFYATHLPPAPAPGSPAATGGPSGPTINIDFGTTTVGNATCGDGRTAQIESIPWQSSTPALAPAELFFELEETLDGDIDGGPGPVPSVTPTSVCARAPIQVSPTWYAVLKDPNGTNFAVYAYSQGWIFLNSSAASRPVPDGSTVVMVSNPSVAGLSFALCVFGDVNLPYFTECALL